LELLVRDTAADPRRAAAAADFLVTRGHTRIAAAAGHGDYWAAGIRILRERLASRGGSVVKLAVPPLDPAAVCG